MSTITRNEAVRLIYRHTHRDYKGQLPDGTRCVLMHRNGGTCLVPLADLTPQEIESALPLAQTKEAARIAKRDAAKVGAQ